MNADTRQDNLTVGTVIAVFIRYRKLIIIPTVLIVIIVLIIQLIILPRPLSYDLDGSRSYRSVGHFVQLPSYVKEELLLTLESKIVEKLNSFQFMSNVVDNFSKENSAFTESLSSKRYASKISLLNYLKRHIDYSFANNILNITFTPWSDLSFEDSELFLLLLFEQLDYEIIGYMYTQYGLFSTRYDIVSNELLRYANILPDTNTQIANNSDRDQLLTKNIDLLIQREKLNAFITNLSTIWAEPPIIFPEEEISFILYLVGALIALTVVGVFIFSALAFILNYIRCFKQDISEMNKIRAAWKN